MIFGTRRILKSEDIRAAHRISTVNRIKQHKCVLAIQDTTDLDFTHHPASIGLGPTDHSALLGLKVHSTFVASTQGVPLGVIDAPSMGKRKRNYWHSARSVGNGKLKIKKVNVG
ncbi:transposase [Scytonema sp. HK-05]|nr:transposase [Scytonema sp. HK-05]